MLGAFQDLLYRVIRQCLKPQLLDLVELFAIGVRSVVLVVVVEAKEGKNLIDRLDMFFARFMLPRGMAGGVFFSLPRRCR